MGWPAGVPQSEESKEKNRQTHLKGQFNRKHGHRTGSKTSPTWNAWWAMNLRCRYPSQQSYPRYGGRGITICDRWLGKEGFQNFLADMGEKPDDTSLGRIDNDGDYTPGNCRWETPKQQAANRRAWGSATPPTDPDAYHISRRI